jgi:ribosomal protein S18 acetylase RimI-like enzyme
VNFELILRRATRADAEVIARHNQALAWESEREKLSPDTAIRGVQAVLEDPHKGFYLVAETVGRIIGQLLITYEWSDWRNKTFWWIQSVYVRPEYRRQGIFRRLYREIGRLALAEGQVAGFRLYVAQTNRSAQATYRRLGMAAAKYVLFEENLSETETVDKHPPDDR